jgi:hypothetical protein
MVILMTATAIHRFVKVWRQASDLPERPRFLTTRHRRTHPSVDGADRPPVLARWREQRSPTARREARAARRNRP